MKKNDTKKNIAVDLVIWTIIFLITATAFVATYHFQFTAPIIAIIWVCWLVLSFLFGFFTSTGKKIASFTKASKAELLKVVWPTRQETIQTTSIVMIMVTVTGLILWGIDSGMMWAIGKITHLG